MKDVQKLIRRKKLIQKIKPNLSYAGILDILKIVLISLIVIKMYGLDVKLKALILSYL